MSITIRSKRTDEQSLSFEQWEDDRTHDTVLLESLAMIATIQADDSICVIAIHEEVTFTIYDTFTALRRDLEIDSSDVVTIIDSLDIVYSKLVE